MLLGTLGASLLRNRLTGKGIYRAGKCTPINRAGEDIVRAGYGFEIQKYYQNEPDIGTYWVALYAGNNSITYFDSFGVEHVPKEIKTFIGRSLSITTNIFRIQAYDWVMCGYFCIGFIDFMLAGKNFLLMIFLKNDNMILSYFKDECYKTNLSEQTKFRLSEIIEIIFIKRLTNGNHAVKN